MMKRLIFWGVVICLLSLFSLPSQPSIAASYFEGKILKIVVGHSVGGGYDRLARLIGRHLPRFIPGSPRIIIENMPGAQTMIAANYLYNIAKPNGLAIGSLDRGLPFAQLLKSAGVKFDLTKFSWIGSAASETMILALRADLPYRTVADLRAVKEEIPLAGVGAGASDTQFSTLLKQFTGIPLKIINYPSSAESILAIERKEVDGRAGSYSSLKPYIERGLVRPFVRSRVPEPELGNLPINEDLTTDSMGKTLMAMLASAERIGRPYVAPPGIPTEAITILRNAFSNLLKDPAVREDAKKIGMSLEYISGDEALKTMNYLANQPDNIAIEFAKYIKF